MLKWTQEPVNMSHASPLKLNTLHDRALMLKKARDFFFERAVMEVDCPIITKYASIDTHIDLMLALYLKEETRYLHSSPEYGMKRLLSLGSNDIYQLSHVFRDEDLGNKHNPEFMMAEWYRLNFTLDEMIEETNDFIKLFIGNLKTSRITYREAFLKYAEIDYLRITKENLLNYLSENKIPFYPDIIHEGKDALLNLIMGLKIEKELGKDGIQTLYHYPASQAALAKTLQIKGEVVAERFEIYYRGIELCNGYHELVDAKEQRNRFIKSNEERALLNKNELPVDEYFLKALEEGLPDCCGVAVGFDRLMMLRQKADHIKDVIPFGWDTA